MKPVRFLSFGRRVVQGSGRLRVNKADLAVTGDPVGEQERRHGFARAGRAGKPDQATDLLPNGGANGPVHAASSSSHSSRMRCSSCAVSTHGGASMWAVWRL